MKRDLENSSVSESELTIAPALTKGNNGPYFVSFDGDISQGVDNLIHASELCGILRSEGWDVVFIVDKDGAEVDPIVFSPEQKIVFSAAEGMMEPYFVVADQDMSNVLDSVVHGSEARIEFCNAGAEIIFPADVERDEVTMIGLLPVTNAIQEISCCCH